MHCAVNIVIVVLETLQLAYGTVYINRVYINHQPMTTYVVFSIRSNSIIVLLLIAKNTSCELND